MESHSKIQSQNEIILVYCLVRYVSYHQMPTYLWRGKNDTLAHQYQNTPLHSAGKNNMYFRKAWCMCAHLSSRSLHMAASVP